MDFIDAARIAKDALEDKKAEDVKILDIRGLSSVADFFVVGSGNNINQLKAMADYVEEKLYEKGLRLHHSEGYQSASWVLLDFNGLVLHLFIKDQREFYGLARVWADAESIN